MFLVYLYCFSVISKCCSEVCYGALWKGAAILGLRILCVIAVHAICLATVRSSPFLMQERSAIGLQERGDVWSVFPVLGIIATLASFYYTRKWLSLRYC